MDAMHASRATFVLEVLGGTDHGARLELDENVLTIGRAREADLVLRDLGVSRRHVQVVASEDGAQLQACAGSAGFMVAGRSHRAYDAKVGDRILIGNTVLLVAAEAPASVAPASARAGADLRTALTGVGAEAFAMASIHALIEALDTAVERTSLLTAMLAWASRQKPAFRVEFHADAQSAASVAASTDSASTVIVVPAPSEDFVSIAFTFADPAEQVTDSFRRMLVVAGRLFGSAAARLRRAEVADGEVAALRTLSFGAAHDFLGSSTAARQLAAKIPRLAASDVGMLLEGETGVGKTFVARLLHEASPRAREPLRVINCAAIPENLIESELFGHERGAFTGAVSHRVGALEATGRGTLFLDEIGELSLGSQAKLLRVLEDRRFERIGSNKTIELHARVVCATNRDLEQMIARGAFRRDLLFRIAVVRVRVPSLRERRDDLPELARQMLADATQTAGRRVLGFSADAMALIQDHSWPGNVRELRNAIEHAIALGEGPLVQAADLPAGIAPAATQPDDPDFIRLPLDMATLERRAVEAALRASAGNRVRAAALLGMNRSTLYNKLKEFGLAG